MYLTRALLPQMLKWENRSGIILNASVTADFILPCVATYGASKAFVDQFAQCLAFENIDKIDVLSYTPSMVQSNAVKLKPRFEILSRRKPQAQDWIN